MWIACVGSGMDLHLLNLVGDHAKDVCLSLPFYLKTTKEYVALVPQSLKALHGRSYLSHTGLKQW